MTNYVWKAKDSNGREVVVEEPGDTAKAAQARLLAEGFSELRLIEGDVQDAVSEGFRDSRRRRGKRYVVNAADRAKVRDQPPMTLRRTVAKAFTQRADVTIILGVVAIAFIYSGNVTGGAIVAAALTLWILRLVWIWLPSVFFRKLTTAESWHQWDRAIKYVKILEFLAKRGSSGIYPAALARYCAKALAGKGDLAAALAYYAPFRGQPGCPDWLHDLMSAGICDAAKQYDRAIEYSLKSIQIKPQASSYRGLASRYLRYKKDVVSARKALAEAGDEPIPEVVMPAVHLTNGILASLEGNDPLAQKELVSCLETAARRKRLPRASTLSTAKAYLACIRARQGLFDEAKRLYEEARPWLVAVNDKELIAECEAALKPPL